jgi:hypothetical protein
MRHLVRVGGTVAATVAILTFGAGAASAHECFNASRSAQGNASVAAHSAAWEEVSLDTILTEFIGLPQPVADCVEASAPSYGIPSSFVFGGKQSASTGVIAENNPNTALLSNGKGIDHAEDAYGDALNAAIGACFAQQP